VKIKTIALVPAAGLGARMGQSQHKAFITLENKPLLWHCLNQLSAVEEVSDIVIALHEDDFELWESQADFTEGRKSWKPITAVIGGETRAHSVLNAFEKAMELSEEDFYACVHDAARPFTGKKLIQEVIQAAEASGAAGCALNVVDTIKQQSADGQLKTLPRHSLKALQTPQVISSSIFKQGWAKWREAGKPKVTDDFQIIENLNVKVTLLEGDPKNKKITFESDI
jgi:2-C-methyl-D-erythritol 4-phosphate cytidylyltransferase